MTAFPDVTVHEITDDDEFLVIACDGMFNPTASFDAKLTNSRHLGLPILASRD